MIDKAAKIYYPSSFYAELFETTGKPTFPSFHCYKYAQDKIKQTALFNLSGIPHPRTRVFYGKRQKSKIIDHFDFPFIAKIPRGSALGRGVFLIRTTQELEQYCRNDGPAYIQEYLPIDRDIRVVVIGTKVVHSYWRIAQEGSHLTNISAGATIELDPVPEDAMQLALYVARQCKWDDVGIDICMYGGKYYVLEGNMKYGRQGFRAAGLDYHQILLDFISQGEI